MRITEILSYVDRFPMMKDPGQILYGLKKAGDDVTLVIARSEGNRDISEDGDIKVKKLSGFKFLYVYWAPVLYLLRNARKIDCLILYLMTINTAVTAAFYRVFGGKGKLVIKMDTDGREWDMPSGPLFRIYQAFFGETKVLPLVLSRLADILIIEAPESKERVSKKYPVLSKKMVVMPNGINHSALESNLKNAANIRREKFIFYAGQLREVKGVDVLIKAFSAVSREFPDWKLVIAGQLMPEFSKLIPGVITSSGMTDKIFIKGHIEGAAFAEYFTRASIFCLPSRHENFPIVLLEAMYYGPAIIASNVGAVNYILDYGGCGLLFEPDDETDLAVKLSTLIRDEHLRETVSAAARKRVMELFTWDKIIPKIYAEIHGSGSL